MSAVIDLPRIRRALSELDRIATEHPEICQGLGQWDEKAVAGIVNGKPGSERQAEYRRKLAAQGIKREVFFATPETQTALAKLRALHPDKTRDNILCDAVINLLAAQRTPDPMPVVTPALVDPDTQRVELSLGRASDRDTTILALKEQGLSNSKIGARVGCSEASIRRALKRLNQETGP